MIDSSQNSGNQCSSESEDDYHKWNCSGIGECTLHDHAIRQPFVIYPSDDNLDQAITSFLSTMVPDHF